MTKILNRLSDKNLKCELKNIKICIELLILTSQHIVKRRLHLQELTRKIQPLINNFCFNPSCLHMFFSVKTV